MTAFSFSSGDPTHLTAAANALMVDLSGPFADLRTFLNGANITDTNVTAAGLTDASLASPTNAVWRAIGSAPAVITGGAAGTYVPTTGGLVASGTGGGPPGLLYQAAAADVAVAGKTTRLRLRVGYVWNAVAPAVNFTFGLHIVSALAGGGGTVAYTLGAAVVGSTVAVNAPGANAGSTVWSSSFDLSTLAGNFYVPGVVLSGATAANSCGHIVAVLEQRHT